MQMAYQTLTLYHKEANAIICTSCTWFPDDMPPLGKSWQLKYGGKMKALSRFHSQRKAEGGKALQSRASWASHTQLCSASLNPTVLTMYQQTQQHY